MNRARSPCHFAPNSLNNWIYVNQRFSAEKHSRNIETSDQCLLHKVHTHATRAVDGRGMWCAGSGQRANCIFDLLSKVFKASHMKWFKTFGEFSNDDVDVKKLFDILPQARIRLRLNEEQFGGWVKEWNRARESKREPRIKCKRFMFNSNAFPEHIERMYISTIFDVQCSERCTCVCVCARDDQSTFRTRFGFQNPKCKTF